jgi:hypothetical protein
MLNRYRFTIHKKFGYNVLPNFQGCRIGAGLESVHQKLATFRPIAFDGTDHDTDEQLGLFRYKLMSQS